MGADRLRTFDQLPAREPDQMSRSFPNGGYYVMRDSWSPTANYLLVDSGPHGTLNCGHAHADALGIDLSALGHTMLIDPGTYTYTGTLQLRDYFRTSMAHNTLSIDSESSSVPKNAFSWRQIARPAAKSWISQKRFDYFAGEHDGYKRLTSPAVHSARDIIPERRLLDHSGSGQNHWNTLLRFAIPFCSEQQSGSRTEKKQFYADHAECFCSGDQYLCVQ